MYILATGTVFFNGGRSGASCSSENIFDNFGKSRRFSGCLSEAGSITWSRYSLLWNACASVTAYGMTEFDSLERSLGTSIFSSIPSASLLPKASARESRSEPPRKQRLFDDPYFVSMAAFAVAYGQAVRIWKANPSCLLWVVNATAERCSHAQKTLHGSWTLEQ